MTDAAPPTPRAPDMLTFLLRAFELEELGHAPAEAEAIAAREQGFASVKALDAADRAAFEALLAESPSLEAWLAEHGLADADEGAADDEA